jgi:hypothetical protein
MGSSAQMFWAHAGAKTMQSPSGKNMANWDDFRTW